MVLLKSRFSGKVLLELNVVLKCLSALSAYIVFVPIVQQIKLRL